MFKKEMRALTIIISLLLSANSFATSTLICDGEPYLFIVHYSHSNDGVNLFELVINEKIILKGKVNKLNSFSLIWPETEPSIKNKLSFSGQLSNGHLFTGKATADTGNIIFNNKNYRLQCDWRM